MSRKEPLSFLGFDEQADLHIYHHGILPHWRQSDCTYFVTFRLADSLPVSKVRELENLRDLWLQKRGISTKHANWQSALAKLPKAERRAFERMLAVQLDKFLDAGHGECLLQQPVISKLVATALDYFHGDRVLTGDFVVMPNHVHGLLRPLAQWDLEEVLQSIKGYTARQINQVLSRSGHVWQRESYDHIVRDWEQLIAFQKYIAANPKKAGLKSKQYFHSEAIYCESQRL